MKCAYYGCLLMVQLACCAVQGQYYFSANNRQEPELLWELGFAAGAINCLTDLGGNKGTGKKFIKDINWNQTRLTGSLFASATWQSRFGVRLQASFGQVSGNDAAANNTDAMAKNRYRRNLHFRTTLFEATLVSEWHLLSILSKNGASPLLSPFLSGGIGFFNYNPQAQLNNIWVNLRPLHTEGQGFKEYADRVVYKPVSWCIPAGAGVKYDASGLVNLRLEISYRFTGTDYLDDVSRNYIDPLLFNRYLPQTEAALAARLADRSAELAGGVKNNKDAVRGNPFNKDAYFSCMLAVSIAFGRIQRK